MKVLRLVFTAAAAAVFLFCLAPYANCACEAAWTDFEQGIAHAKKEGRPIIVDIGTGWCRDCKKLEKTTFADPEIIKRLDSGFVAVKVDGDARADIVKKFQVFAYPTIIVLDRGGNKITQKVGYMSPAEFAAFLDGVKKK